MRVALDKSRDRQLTLQVDHPRFRADERPDVIVTAHCQNGITGHGDGLCLLDVVIHCDDLTPTQDEICHLSGSCGSAASTECCHDEEQFEESEQEDVWASQRERTLADLLKIGRPKPGGHPAVAAYSQEFEGQGRASAVIAWPQIKIVPSGPEFA